MKEKMNLNAIDIMKFIATLLIVALHMIPEDGRRTWYSYIVGDVLSRVAVPFFFVVSGYLLAFKDIMNKKIILHYIKRVAILYCLWSLIYFPANIYLWSISNESLPIDILLYIKNFIFVGSFEQFWYFPALIFDVVVIHILLKKISINKVLLVSLVLYIIGIFGDAYYGFLSISPVVKNLYDTYLSFFDTTRNGLFFGMLFVSIGIFIKNNNITIKIKKSKVLFLISLGLMFSEVYILNKLNVALDFNIYISLIPATFFLFCILKELRLEDKPVYNSLRHCSVIIYTGHFIMNLLLEGVVLITGLEILINNFILHFISVTILSIIFSYSILYLQYKKNVEWIKYLY